MKRAVPWTLAALFFVAFVASFAELHRLRIRFGEVTKHQFHDHQEVREFIIRSALDGLESPIVILGDSLVEMAQLPVSLCGKPVVNAGIGGAQTSDFMRLGPKLLERTKPTAIVVGLGANDRTATEIDGLVVRLRAISPLVLPMPTTRNNFSASDLREDGVHLTKVASARWVSKMTADLEHAIENCD